MADVDQITFTPGIPPVGQITLFTTEEETKVHIRGLPPAGAMTRSRRVRREELLAVRGMTPQRIRVAFVEDTTTVTQPTGKKEKTVEPYAGGTYEVERTSEAGALMVFDAAGAKVRFGVAAQIAGLYRDFGREESAIKLPSGPQRIGQPSPEIAESMSNGVSRAAAISKVENPEAVLIDIYPTSGGALCGRYKLSMTVIAKAAGSVITLDLKGWVVLRDLDGAPLEVRVEGPFENVGEDPASNLPPGQGAFKMVQTVIYARA